MKNSFLFYNLIIFNIILMKAQLISSYHDELKESCPNDTISSSHPFVGDCQKFILCSNGICYVKKCAYGTAFDKYRLFCKQNHRAECDYWNTTNCNAPQLSGNNASDILCSQLSNGLYPYPFDNYYYIKCVPAKTFIKNCPYGKNFSTTKGKCVSVHKPQFENLDNNDLYKFLHGCPLDKRGKYLYPYTPRKYIKCVWGQMKVLDCGPLEVFSISQGTCLPEGQVPHGDHVALPTTKPIYTNGPAKYNDTIDCPIELFGLYPHPFNNQKYLKCVYGRLYEKICFTGYVYNIFTKFCERNETNLFKTLPPTGNNNTDKSKVEIRTKDGSTFLKCPKDLDGTFIHPFYCDKYIICSPFGTNIRNCPIGNVFNFHKGTCGLKSELKDQYHVECIENNENSEDKNTLGVYCEPKGNKTYPHPTNWHKFILCSDGKLLVRWCPKNKFFDLESRKCINDSNEIEE